MTLMRFAQLTARLDGCVSRDALLKQEGLTLEDWLQGQKYWLDELTNHSSANRPLLFNHYLSLLDQERQRLGKPPLAGKTAVQPSARKLYDLTAPQLGTADAAFPGPSLGRGPFNDPLTFGSSDIPDFLRPQAAPPPVQVAPIPQQAPAYLPAAYQQPPSAAMPPAYVPAAPAPAPAFVPATPAFVPAPYQPSAPAPPPDIPDFLRAAASMPAAPAPIPYQPPLHQPSYHEPYSDIPAFLRGAPAAVPSQPAPLTQPRLRLEDYVELVFSLEKTASHLQAQLLQRFGFEEPAWIEEIRRWQQQFITFPESRQRFEQLMLARRSYGP